MNTINTITNMNFGAYIPLSEYKGPILKLTPTDKKKIAALQKEITEHEIELIKLSGIKERTRYKQDKDFYSCRIDKISAVIDELRNAIRQIKVDRITKQRAKLAKKGLDTTV